MLSGIILSINPTLAVIILAVIIVFFLLFTLRFFDNSYETVKVSDIVSFTLAVKKLSKENIREYLSEKIQASELPNILHSAKYIFLKPLSLETNKKIEIKSLIAETKETAKIIWSILGHMPPFILIYWTMSLVLIF